MSLFSLPIQLVSIMGKKIVRKKALVSFAIGNKSEDAKEGASKKRRMQ
jgi:hypothetical protein